MLSVCVGEGMNAMEEEDRDAKKTDNVAGRPLRGAQCRFHRRLGVACVFRMSADGSTPAGAGRRDLVPNPPRAGIDRGTMAANRAELNGIL